ncbi:MAG: GntR family transcriptional regulator [Alphaproteobacteria bacterium]|nr:GntR family transcriptional regulator [Alphaproteobacteria bacterium]
MTLTIRTVPDQLADVVRARILAGALKPGDPIRQDALAAELGVSKIPLREALARLEQAGLLTLIPNRGFVVRPMSRSELDEIYALRLKLEPDAVALGAKKANEAERGRAIEALATFKREAAGRRGSGGVHNRMLHLALIRPCGQDLTSSILEQLHVMADRYVCKHLEPLGRNVRADREHDALVEAWLERDTARVKRLMRQHIAGTLKDLHEQLGSPAPAEHVG